MTEQNVVPLEALSSNPMANNQKTKDLQDNEDAGSDWSEQMREANEKSGFTTQPKRNTGNETLFSDRKNDTGDLGSGANNRGPFGRNDAKPSELTVKHLVGPNSNNDDVAPEM